MKKFIGFLFSVLFIIGCGSDNSTKEDSTNSNTTLNPEYFSGARVVSTVATLPTCNTATQGELFYISSLQQFQFCNNNSYQVISLVGPAGATGLKGATGTTGSVGATGATGATGPIGLTGLKGATGTTGSIGLTGATGTPGTAGVQGIQGIQGNPGIDGLSLTWKGVSNTAPINPQLNWIYYNSTSYKTYIYNGSSWDVLIDNYESAIKKIIAFQFNEFVGITTIDNVNHTVVVQCGSDINFQFQNLTANFIIAGAGVEVNNTIQSSGVTQNNFFTPVIYKVFSNDGTYQEYTVSVVLAMASNISSGLLLYYNFNDKTSTDYSGNNNNGVDTIPSGYSNCDRHDCGGTTKWARGWGTQGTDKTTIASPNGFNTATSISISFWISGYSNESFGTVISKGAFALSPLSNYETFGINLNKTTVFQENHIIFYLRLSAYTNFNITSSSTIGLNSGTNLWNHVVCTYGDNVVRIYINGVIDTYSKLTNGGTLVNNTLPIVIGADNNDAYHLTEKMLDDFRIYNRVINQLEIQDLYNE